MRVKQIPNYELIIKTNSYTGNFERELVSYALGTLDNVQMEMGDFHGSHEMDLFWKEEFNSERKDYYDDYELKDEYLMETYQDVDDWEQVTFYHMADNCNSLAIQLVKPLNEFLPMYVTPFLIVTDAMLSLVIMLMIPKSLLLLIVK